jgi:phosphatidylinositol alpha-mannosyltransferase
MDVKYNMKIGIVCPYNIYLGGGVQEYVIALREGLEKRGYDASIITPQPNRTKNKTADPPAKTIMIGGAAPFRGIDTTVQVSASVGTEKLKTMLRREDFDILHFHEPWIPILSRQILSRSSAINIGTFHAALPNRRLSKTFERVVTPYTKSILKYLDVCTAVSEPATLYLRSLSQSRQIRIIPNGIDLAKYQNSGQPPAKHDTKTIYYVGRLEKRKGVRYLIDAFDLLTQSDSSYQLIIAGDGPERNKLKEYADENKIKNIRFLGYVNEDYKRKLFWESDVFCSPAIHGESFGIVLLEAMAAGCAVVAGSNSGYASVMKDTGAISLVNPRDTLEFARRLSIMANDEPLRKTWRQWAAREIRQYSYENIVDSYIKLYTAAYKKQHS